MMRKTINLLSALLFYGGVSGINIDITLFKPQNANTVFDTYDAMRLA